MAKKVLDAKAKEKRQKVMAVVLAVVFLAVGAFQFPRMWKMLHPKVASQPTAISTASTPSPSSPLPPGLAVTGVAQPVSATSPTTGAPTASAGQLVAFGRFTSKNPFVQQVVPCDGPCSASSPAPVATKTTPADRPPVTLTRSPQPNSPPPPRPTTSTTPRAPASLTHAVISVNGAGRAVAVGEQFPSASPTFVLRSVGRTSAKIGIVGGSYSDGSPVVTLKLGKKLTLMNTADGTRYALILVSVS